MDNVDHQNIYRKYLIAIATLAVCLFIAGTLKYFAVGSQKTHSKIINISGRQRMLSQRIALLANILVEGKGNEAEVLEQYRDSIILFQNSHEKLSKNLFSGIFFNIENNLVKEVYFSGENSVDKEVRLYIEHAMKVLQSYRAQPEIAAKSLEYIDSKHAILLKKLDHVVKQFELDSNHHTEKLQIIEVIIYLIVIMILIYQTVRVFKPTLKSLRKNHHELLEKDERFDLCIKGSRDGIWDWKIKENVLFLSKQFNEILGSDISNKKDPISYFYALVHPKDRTKLKNAYEKHVKEKEAFDVQVRIKFSQNDYRWVNIRGKAVWNIYDEAIRIAGSMSDIHDEKMQSVELEEKTAQALSLAKVKTEFLANMSHELRTPMNGIIGMIQLLNETDLSQKQQELLLTIKESSSDLHTILNEILDYSKLEDGKVELKPQDFDLKASISDVVNLHLENCALKGLAFKRHVDSCLPKYLKGDITRIKQVLNNLLTNAVKYTEEGSINLSVELDYEEKDQIFLKFIVSDTGIGMTKLSIESIFSEFSKLDSSLSRKHGGAGLGLAISKKLSHLLGGDLLCTSEINKGTRFEFIIPMQEGKEVIKVEKNVFDDNANFAKNHPHQILVAEDNAVNLALITKILSKLGYHADVAMNGQQAVEAVEKKDYSFILMDLQMPEKDGITATKEIMSIDKNVIIVALTANAFEDDKKACFDAGMKDFIAKPLNIKDVIRVLSTDYDAEEAA